MAPYNTRKKILNCILELTKSFIICLWPLSVASSTTVLCLTCPLQPSGFFLNTRAHLYLKIFVLNSLNTLPVASLSLHVSTKCHLLRKASVMTLTKIAYFSPSSYIVLFLILLPNLVFYFNIPLSNLIMMFHVVGFLLSCLEFVLIFGDLQS